MKTYFTFMKESHTLYHKSYTDAINAALAHHKDKEGLNVSDEDRDTHIAMGPRKPAEGETVEHHIPATDKNGKRRIIHIQVYNKGGPTPFELNAYSSGDKVAEETVDVSEGLASTLGNVAKRALNVAKPAAIGAAKLTVKKVVKPAAKHVFNVVKHGVLRSILEDPTEMRHSSDSLGDHMALKTYTDKLGPKHIDRHDLLTAASHMAFGNMDHLKKHLKALDTDVRDKVLEYVARRHHAELGYRVRKEEAELDEQVSFKKTISGHHIHHNGERVGQIIKTNSMGGLGYSVRIGDDEVSSERSLDAAKESAKYHLTSLKEQEELDEMRNDAVTAFASKQHDVWRKGFDPEGTGKERIKKNSDGSEGNINVPFKKLHPDWQKENLSAGKAALQAVRKHPNDMESAADHVHKEWMKRNPKADYNAHLHVPYSDLPEDEKQKDRDHVNTMKSLLGKKQQKIKPLAEISAALAKRASRLAMDK